MFMTKLLDDLSLFKAEMEAMEVLAYLGLKESNYLVRNRLSILTVPATDPETL